MLKRKRRHPAILVLACISLIISLILWNKIRSQGAFNPPAENLANIHLDCSLLHKIPGPTSFTITESQELVIASQDRQAGIYDQSWPQGAIYLASPTDQSKPPINISKEFKDEFHPRSLALFEDQHGRTLFVVNYRTGGFSVEIFDFKDQKLIHKKTLTSSHFVQPGAIAARDHQSFYLINEHGLFTSTGHFIEDFFNLKKSHLLYFDGMEFTKLIDGFKLAYGLSYEAGEQLIYLSDMKGKKVYVYQHNVHSVSADFVYSTDTEFHPAGLFIDQDSGALWMTGYPQLLQANSHMMNPKEIPAPSQVIAYSSLKNKNPEFTKVMQSLSSGLSSATQVVPYSKNLILGGAFENHLVTCKTKSDASLSFLKLSR